jgi:hypothetical protein
MKKILTLVPAVAFCLGGASLPAEDAPSRIPKILQIFQEEVKPGKGAAHEKVEAGWPAAFRKAGSPGYYLAMTATGQAWFVTPWDSFAGAEKENKAIDANAALTAELERLSAADGDLLSKVNGMWAVHREELSYRPDWDTAKMRYFSVTTIRLNPGYGRDFIQARKIVNEGHDKAKLDERWATYEVVAGAPSGTYLIFQPHASLAEWDAIEVPHGKPYQDALGEDNQKRLRDFSREGVKSSESVLFSFSPKMSFLSKEFMERDPDYWMPKPAAPARAKKEPPKP